MTPAHRDSTSRHLAIVGHRGARALSPENTLAGLQTALSLGVAGIEIDVAMTADGVCVLHHDPFLHADLTRGSDGTWLERTGPSIASVTLAELQRFDVGRVRPGSEEAARWPDLVPADGARIPTFSDACALVRAAGRRVELAVEIKTFPDRPQHTQGFERILDGVVEVLVASGLEASAMVESFDWRVPIRLRDLRPALRRGFLTSRAGFGNLTPDAAPLWTAGFDPARFGGRVDQAIAAAGGQVWAIDHRDLDAAERDHAGETGLDLLPWTVNRAADFDRLLDLGVTAVITDRPEIAAAVAAARGIPARIG